MRLLGYKDALREAGIRFDQNLVIPGYVGYQFGIEAATKVVDKKYGITAVFATADILAVGMVKGFHKHNLSVPEDISIIGFDDIYQAEICDPGLTTIRQNIKDKGNEVTKIIVSATKNSNFSKKEIVIPLEIIERESVRAI